MDRRVRKRVNGRDGEDIRHSEGTRGKKAQEVKIKEVTKKEEKGEMDERLY